MSIGYNPSIATSGLIQCLDAANLRSYTGSGTSWLDISGTNNNGTLVNGPIYSSSNLGGINFDGTDDYVSFTSNPSLTNAVTIEIWVKLSATTASNGWILGREGSYRLLYGSTNFQWVCATVNNGWYTAGTSISATGLTTANNFFQVVGVYNGSNNLIYVNGTLRNTGATISGNILNSSTYNLMSDTSGDANIDWGKGLVYVHRMYNIALSADQIAQNYNATRGRYGL
jgi:hypothetical protein